jgi:hypothetical protein
MEGTDFGFLAAPLPQGLQVLTCFTGTKVLA